MKIIELKNIKKTYATGKAAVAALQGVSLIINQGEFVAIMGPSGSGKSTLAFDTIFAEGQRRYVESLSAYARQFLNQMAKPDVDEISGLSPAITPTKLKSSDPCDTLGPAALSARESPKTFFEKISLE